MSMTEKTLRISLPDEMWARIERLSEAVPNDYVDETTDLESLVTLLLDHVQQGIYRSGAWERQWLVQCFGEEAVSTAYEPVEDPLNRRLDS